ncbi:silicon efflux transporter LSI2 [Pelomyxa schiedti]|nr:silicon efflux transporter LSI2 [Pelomyxa schiedti]
MLTPLVVSVCLRQQLPLLPYLLALATCANVGSSVTPIGNPQNIIIASYSQITFLDFLKYLTAATVSSLILNVALLGSFLFFHRKLYKKDTHLPLVEEGSVEMSPTQKPEEPSVSPSAATPEPFSMAKETPPLEGTLKQPSDDLPITVEPSPPQIQPGPGPTRKAIYQSRALKILIVFIVLVIMAGFLSGLDLGWTCIAGASALIIGDAVIFRRDAYEILPKVDWLLLLFFAGLFVIIRGVFNSGYPLMLFNLAAPYMQLDTALSIAIYCAFLLAASNVLSNVPTILLLSPFLSQLTLSTRAWMLAAFVSTVAGNLTLVGSVANIIVAEHSEPHYHLTFFKYLPFGFPSTLLVTALGATLVTLVT